MKNKWHDLSVHFDEMEDITIQNIEKRILITLCYQPKRTFNELWKKLGPSNKFAYHLKVLEKKSLVEKANDGKYILTLKGKKHVAYVEQKSGEHCEFPVVAVITVIMKDNKYLMTHRTKEPFYGYWGLHGGKLRSTNYILEQANESIKTETGLTCDVALKGLFSSKTYVNNQFSYHHQLFIVKATNPKWTLLKETKKGLNKWVSSEELKKLNTLPNIPHLIKIATGKRFRWIEADRFQENGVFVRMDVKKDILL